MTPYLCSGWGTQSPEGTKAVFEDWTTCNTHNTELYDVLARYAHNRSIILNINSFLEWPYVGRMIEPFPWDLLEANTLFNTMILIGLTPSLKGFPVWAVGSWLLVCCPDSALFERVSKKTVQKVDLFFSRYMFPLPYGTTYNSWSENITSNYFYQYIRHT